MILTGAPACFQHAGRQRLTCVCLPDPVQAVRYSWPVEGLDLVLVYFCTLTEDQDRALIAELMAGDPKALSVRYWPSDRCLFYRP